MGTISESPLGRVTRYPEHYDAGLLFPVERAPQRNELGLSGTLPFTGADRWTAWEVTWRDAAGRVQAAIARFDVPCTSPRIVESKSVKLWLASLYDARFETPAELRDVLAKALSNATGALVDVQIDLPDRWSRLARSGALGSVIDEAIPSAFPSTPDASLLRAAGEPVEQTLVSNLFRSVCPVTGQPDYASVAIRYRGTTIERRSLAAYLFGYRRHPGFHEHCVERMFVDVMSACAPERLAVEARFTRRGGLDINPFRTSDAAFGEPGAPSTRQ